MEERPIVETPSVKLLGINISNNMSWHDHVVSIAKTASQKLEAQIRPSLEYCSHVWGCAPNHSLKLLDSIQKRVVRVVDAILTKDLHSLEHPCFTDFTMEDVRAVRKKNTRKALRAHPYQVEVTTPPTSLLQHSFIWKTSTLWNELPRNLFPDGYNLQRFKANTMEKHGRKSGRELKLTQALLEEAQARIGKGESKRSVAASLGVNECSLRKRLRLVILS
nr:unnamed protein product [Callosobruchus analis]